MNFKLFLILALTLLLNSESAYSSIWNFVPITRPHPVSNMLNKDGLQLVGLSKWSETSTRNCADAIIASTCRQFEFSYCPFFNISDPFGNADVINSISDVKITETIFLGWRQEALMLEDVSYVLQTLSNRAEQVNKHINEIRGRVDKIILVPILEDYWTEGQWLQAVRVIAAQLDSGDKVTFRRSEMMNLNPPPTNIVTRIKNGQSYNFTGVYLEAHKIDFTGEAKTISNDGGFVYNSSILLGLHESAEGLKGMPGGYKTFAKWLPEAKASAKTVMLHRPAYNLFPRSISNGYISYRIPSITLDNRTDDNSDPAFSSYEAAIAQQFLSPVKNKE